MTFRAFISADIVPGEQLVGLLRELQRTGAGLKVVRPELMHITLKFLGDTDEALVDEIVASMEEATRSIAPFRLTLKGMGAFPSMSNIRVVWVGMEGGQALQQVAPRLDELLSTKGFVRDTKGFKPHLTVARTKDGGGTTRVQEIVRQNAATVFGEHAIDRVILKKSVLGPRGPTYSVVREVALSGQ
ncbi:MAG: RNA 2',3'-cyclic phosphodiesterase [Thermoplasmata archaeon]|jgi:2'-5' RNA ligase|nr:RNA 2',3'-cyclic phosphodiesterase [Thermoplasmata archaeon]